MYICKKTFNCVLKNQKGLKLARRNAKLAFEKMVCQLDYLILLKYLDSKISLFKGNKTNLAGCFKAFNCSNINDIKVIYI